MGALTYPSMPILERQAEDSSNPEQTPHSLIHTLHLPLWHSACLHFRHYLSEDGGGMEMEMPFAAATVPAGAAIRDCRQVH